MSSEAMQHAIWAAFAVFAIGFMSSCAEGVSDNSAETTAKYIESKCKRGQITGSAGTHWICD